VKIAKAKVGLRSLVPAAVQHPHVVVGVLKMLNVKIVTEMGTIGKNKRSRQRSADPKHSAIPLVMRVKWWRDQSVTDDKGGSFNLDHYMRICRIKIEQYGR
jgi:hypothetical protein